MTPSRLVLNRLLIGPSAADCSLEMGRVRTREARRRVTGKHQRVNVSSGVIQDLAIYLHLHDEPRDAYLFAAITKGGLPSYPHRGEIYSNPVQTTALVSFTGSVLALCPSGDRVQKVGHFCRILPSSALLTV